MFSEKVKKKFFNLKYYTEMLKKSYIEGDFNKTLYFNNLLSNYNAYTQAFCEACYIRDLCISDRIHNDLVENASICTPRFYTVGCGHLLDSYSPTKKNLRQLLMDRGWRIENAYTPISKRSIHFTR